MNIQVAVLCDAATDSNGKLNILGAFDTIFAQQLPAVHPQCSVALRMTFSNVEDGQHKLQLHFVDEDGKFVMPSMDIPFEVGLLEEVHFVSRNFVINIQQLKFETPGFYSIDISLDDKPQASIPLLVKLAPQAAQESKEF